jgi:hypothetical protein
MPISTAILRSEPGIKRDGTKFAGDFYTDGKWVRFQRGLPRKIGGYRSISKYLSEISRGFNSFTQQGLQYCHSGSAGKIERFTIDSTKNSSIITERTPAGFTSDDLNQWMFQNAYDASTTENMLFAHVAPNLECVCNDLGGDIYFGNLTGTAALTQVAIPAGANATGGIVMLFPYLFYYGTAGIVGWSVAGTPSDLSGSGSGIARVWSQKIIKGMPLRAGSGSAPAGIFWAYDAVIRASFAGGATVFQFDVIATDTSIMSPDSVIDYDGIFFWAGVDRFLMFNGVVREVPNQMNLNWFFDNINPTQRSKVFSFKVPHFGEIWFCYPRGDATECTHAVIYNVREQSWYDTELPADGRASGGYNNGFAAPLLTGCFPSDSGYNVWIHEQGVDEIDGQSLQPIESYFETADLSNLTKGQNKYVRITTIEPDFIQNGPMTVQVTGRANARAQEVYSSLFTFPETATTPHEQIVMLKEQRRELRVRFSSNAVGGDYQMGQIIGHLDTGDGTVLG